MRNQILTRAADARSPREAVRLVLDELVETHTSPSEVSLENVKKLLVDAVRAWQGGKNDGPPAQAVGHFSDAMSQAASF